MREIICYGKKYETMTDFAHSLGIKPNNLWHYLKKKTPEEIYDRYNEKKYEVDGNITYLYLRSRKREIVGKVIIDTEDLSKVLEVNDCWSIQGVGYATAYDKGKFILLHHIIQPKKDGLETDHINCNKLDNRKANLRYATRSDNCQNVGKKKTKGSKYKGVYKASKYKRKYQAKICVNYEKKILGHYETETEAAKAYDEAAIKYHGAFAKTNKMLGLL